MKNSRTPIGPDMCLLSEPARTRPALVRFIDGHALSQVKSRQLACSRTAQWFCPSCCVTPYNKSNNYKRPTLYATGRFQLRLGQSLLLHAQAVCSIIDCATIYNTILYQQHPTMCASDRERTSNRGFSWARKTYTDQHIAID